MPPPKKPSPFFDPWRQAPPDDAPPLRPTGNDVPDASYEFGHEAEIAISTRDFVMHGVKFGLRITLKGVVTLETDEKALHAAAVQQVASAGVALLANPTLSRVLASRGVRSSSGKGRVALGAPPKLLFIEVASPKEGVSIRDQALDVLAAALSDSRVRAAAIQLGVKPLLMA